MNRLAVRSLLVLVLLFGLLFAVGIAVLYHFKLPLSWAVWYSVAFVLLQYVLSPFFIGLYFKIRWRVDDEFSPEFHAYLAALCRKRRIPVPRLGIIEDGNPNAFTYGHVPADARVVVTRGLMEMLDEEEFRAVVAHEVGHIRNYDFIVMTFAALVPMLLYVLYVWTRERDRSNPVAIAVAVGAYLAYLVSEFTVLLLSRIREYFADEHAAESVQDANAISSALIKIAYGLARLPQEAPKKVDKKLSKEEQAALQPGRVAMTGALGFCSFKSAGPLAMAAADTSGAYTPETLLRAMQWDLWNPWARFFEWQSTHPLVARRVQAASVLARRRRQTVAYPICQPTQTNLWPSFRRDLLYLALPWLGAVVGLGLGLLTTSLPKLAQVSPTNFLVLLMLYKAELLAPALLLGGLSWLVRLRYSFRTEYRPATVSGLIQELEVSHIHCIPVELHGLIIGRGVPGLFWSKDLVLQDDTGFITLIYRQPFSFLETLFGLFKVDSLIGEQATVRGWYRRGPIPYLEINEVTMETGGPVRCFYRQFLFTLAWASTLFGGAALLFRLLNLG